MRLAQKNAELAELQAATADAFETIGLIEPVVAIQRIEILSRRRREAEHAIDALRRAAMENGARAKLADKSLREADATLRVEEAAAEARRLSGLSGIDVSAPKGG
ncbi:hypothetical protein ACNHKD_16710 [Methylocystis sp. JAN1]|uniref:hypothetical protein n=1 Tax=Methylocystis sp. JAN1 TaxID=3397211 RepID=UPI003FA2F6B2